jgi:hypothetical protein
MKHYEIFKNTFISLLKFLNVENSQQNLSLIDYGPSYKIYPSSRWIFNTKSDYSINYLNTAFRARIRSHNTNEFKSLLNELNNIPIIQRHLIRSGKRNPNLQTIDPILLIQNFLYFYVKRNKNFSTNSRIIKSLYLSSIRHFNKSFFETEYLAYLENVIFETKIINISNNIKITSLTENDIVRIYNSDDIFSRFYSGKWLATMSSVQSLISYNLRTNKLSLTSDKKEEQKYDNIEKEIDTLLDSIRCISANNINRSPIIMKVKHYPFYNHQVRIDENTFIYYPNRNSMPKALDRLTKDLFYKIPKACNNHYELANIFRRLRLKNIRYDFEDHVVDLFICFEFMVRLLIPKRHTYRNLAEMIAIIIPALLTEDSNERLKMYRTIKKGYGVRSRIVHAGKAKMKEKETIEIVEHIFKRALRIIILNYNNIPRKAPHEWLIMPFSGLNK